MLRQSDLRGAGARVGEFAGTTPVLAEQSIVLDCLRRLPKLWRSGLRRGIFSMLAGARWDAQLLRSSAVHPTNMGDLNLLLVREDVAL